MAKFLLGLNEEQTTALDKFAKVYKTSKAGVIRKLIDAVSGSENVNLISYDNGKLKVLDGMQLRDISSEPESEDFNLTFNYSEGKVNCLGVCTTRTIFGGNHE